MSIDLQGVPTRACPLCGHTFFKAKVHFDDEYDLAFYDLTGECDDCGALVTLPTPLDHPEYTP